MKKHLDAILLGVSLAIVFVASKIGLVYFEGHIIAFILFSSYLQFFGFLKGEWWTHWQHEL